MITRYTLSLQKELLKPTSVSADFFQSGNTGFSLDYFYGPYDMPENDELLQFTYEDEDENIITRPNANLDGPSGEDGVWHTEDSNPVYNTRLDYQKALAKQMLTDVKQFFPGKKVAFIDDYGNPVEYVVIPRTEEGHEDELYFEDARLVDMYKVSFDSLEAQGAQNPVEVVSRYYTLPKSEFTPPTEKRQGDWRIYPMLFGGWVFGKDVAGSDVPQLLGPTYSVGQAVDLAEICRANNIKKSEVKFYATYITSSAVMVDFENGYYNGENEFVSFDGKSDMSGYLKVQVGNNPNNEAPDDWTYAYESYFTRGTDFSSADNEDERCTYYARGWYWPWQKLQNKTVVQLAAGYQWTEDNFNSWFDDVPTGSFNPWFPNQSSNMSGNSAPEYVYVGTIDEVTKDNFKAVSWYKLEKGVGRQFYYTKCGPHYNDYRNEDLYTQIVRDSYTMFNNGEMYDDTVYDCFAADMYTAYNGITLQLNTEMRPFYSEKYEFDCWEVVPMKYNSQQDDGYVEIQGAKYSDNCKYATVRLDSTYDETVDEETVTLPADKYVFRAVYRVREGFYAKLSIANNYIDSLDNCPKGSVVVRGTVKTMRGDKRTLTIGTLGYDGDFTISASIDVDNNIKVVQSLDEDGYRVLSMDPRFVLSFNLTPVPDNIGTDAFYTWTGDVTEVNRLTKQTGRPVEADGDYRYKAWFVHNGDVSATVRVTKRLSTPQTNVVQGFNGSTVGVYGWKYMDNTNGNPVGTEVISNLGYMFDKSSVSESYVSVTQTPMFSVVPVSNTDGAQLITLSPTALYGMTIDESNPLDNPASISIDETHHGYCYVKATEGANNGAKFIMWSDGDTNPVKKVDVTMPTLYEYTAVFQGEPITVDGLGDSAVASALASYNWQASNTGNGGGNTPTNTWYEDEAVMNNLSHNLIQVEMGGDRSMFVNVPGAGVTDDPTVISEFSEVERILVEKTPVAEPVAGNTVYDYNGNQYKETVVETGKNVTLN